MAGHRARALSALREARVQMINVDAVRQVVVAKVRGHAAMRTVTLHPTGWECTCTEWKRSNRCAHIYAVRLVTDHGHDS